ncbi:MAG: RNA polymerase sigma factor, partial [Candidatus Zixiibacteriota bacterium]
MAKTNDKQLEELVEKAKEGNREAFSEIMQITMNKTLALTYKYTQDMESAKDMTQETYIAIWEHIKDFKGEAKFESWLYRIASNKCLNYLKKVKRVSFNNEMEQQPVDNPEKQLITKELKE